MTYILFGIEQNLLQNHSVTGTAWESQAIELEFLATTPSNNETPELPHRKKQLEIPPKWSYGIRSPLGPL